MRVMVIRAYADFQVGNIIDIQPNQLQPLSAMNYVRVLTAAEAALDAAPRAVTVDDGIVQLSPLSSMTVAELRAYAAEGNIDLGDASRKADIIAVIELASERT